MIWVSAQEVIAFHDRILMEIWENWQIYKSEYGSAMEKTVILLVLAQYFAFILLFIDYSLITLAQFLSSLTGRCFFSLHGLHFGALVP